MLQTVEGTQGHTEATASPPVALEISGLMNSTPHDKDAFDVFYTRNAAVALSVARRRLPAHLAEDVVAEAFVLAWSKGAYRYEQQRARAWLLTAVYNLYRNTLRKSAKEIASEPAVLSAFQESQVQGSAADHPDARYDNEHYDHAWAELTASDREILTLAYHDQLVSADLESIFGITSLAVRTRLSRARARFRKHYEKTSQADAETQLEKR